MVAWYQSPLEVLYSDQMTGFEFHPLTADHWEELVKLFEHHGNPGYCWCMLWRLRSSAYHPLRPEERKGALHALVERDTPTGVLGYIDGQPVGWCSVAPRESYDRLENSKALARLDDAPVWSVVCFFIARRMRHQGFSLQLLQAAVGYATSRGARIIEGYPVEAGQSYQFMGAPAIFRKAGFSEAGRAPNGRSVVRYIVPAD